MTDFVLDPRLAADTAFIADHCAGFDAWADHVREVTDTFPDHVADIELTGAQPVVTDIERLDAEGWEELEPHALSPRAAAGTTPSSRVRRVSATVTHPAWFR